jgi:glucose uptake protein GlcU
VDPNLIVKTATVLLTLGILGGLIMAITRFRGKPRPATWLAMLHGLAAAAALTLLLYASLTVGLATIVNIALVLFVAAAIGGVVMNLKYHWSLRPLPVWLLVVHGAIAGSGYLLLLASVFSTHV